MIDCFQGTVVPVGGDYSTAHEPVVRTSRRTRQNLQAGLFSFRSRSVISVCMKRFMGIEYGYAVMMIGRENNVNCVRCSLRVFVF